MASGAVDVDVDVDVHNVLSDSNEAGVGAQPAKTGRVRPKRKRKTKPPKACSGDAVVPKERKNRSFVWNYFIKFKRGTFPELESVDGFQRGKCKGCDTIMICDSKYGTTNMKRHIETCLKLKGQVDLKQMLLNATAGDVSLRAPKLDQNVYREFLANMIVRHELPFLLVEFEGVRDCHAYLNPDVKHITRNTCKADILKLYKMGKCKVKEMLSSCPGRISLTSDFWTSMKSDSYMCITAHFVDSDWKLREFLLCFCCFPPPHNGPFISDKFSNLLGESGWNIEYKLMAITLDNATNNDTFVESYMTKLVSKGALPLRGRLFRIRCAAHVINLIVKAGLEEIDEVIWKVRESVKYVKGSPSRLVKFNEAAKDKKIPTVRKLKQDTLTRWNSTYLMLESALYYKDVFPHLAILDKHYCFCPLPHEWEKVDVFCKFFQVYYDLTNLFSGTKYPTANLFFHGVSAIQLHLQEESLNPNQFIRSMVSKMQRKFDSYWEDCNLILSVAVVLDPRYKLKLIEFSYEKLYGVEDGALKAKSVYDTIVALFSEYKANSSSSISFDPHPKGQPSVEQTQEQERKSRWANDFDKFVQSTVRSTSKSEFDLYLDEPLTDRNVDLDILAWWKSVQYRWPVLAELARDVLSIPITSVPSEAAFSVGGRILKPSRCSLAPDNVEALICSRNWNFGIREMDAGHVDEDDESAPIFNLDGNDEAGQEGLGVPAQAGC